jgi:membrane-bound ClpP family serine protease
VRVVRICLSIAAICLAIGWASILLFILHVLPPVAPYNSVGGIIALGGHLVAFIAAIIASIAGISAVVRHREDCTRSDFSLLAAAVLLCAFFTYYILTRPPVY